MDESDWDWLYDESPTITVNTDPSVVGSAGSNPLTPFPGNTAGTEETTSNGDGATPLSPGNSTSSGGFWESLGNAFSNTFGGVASNAVDRLGQTANTALNAAGTSANRAVNTVLPAATQMTAAQVAQQKKLLLYGALAVVAVLGLYWLSKRAKPAA